MNLINVPFLALTVSPGYPDATKKVIEDIRTLTFGPLLDSRGVPVLISVKQGPKDTTVYKAGSNYDIVIEQYSKTPIFNKSISSTIHSSK